MIEGLKVTVDGTELKELCAQRAEHHRQRAKVYAVQEATMQANEIEGMSYSGGDPKRAVREKRELHESEAAELDFIAAHLVLNEQYLLDGAALAKLGISRRGY